MISFRPRRTLAASVAMLVLAGTAACAQPVVAAPEPAPSVSTSVVEETPAAGSPEALYAALGVSDWADGEQGLMIDPPSAPEGFPAELMPLVHVHLTGWMGHAVLDPKVWHPVDEQAALDSYLEGVPEGKRAAVSERWNTKPDSRLHFGTRFAPGVEVVGVPKVTAVSGAQTNNKGESQFVLASTAVYIVRSQDRVAPIILNRELTLKASSGDYASRGDYAWNLSVSGSGITCGSADQQLLSPDFEDTVDDVRKRLDEATELRQTAERGEVFDFTAYHEEHFAAGSSCD